MVNVGLAMNQQRGRRPGSCLWKYRFMFCGKCKIDGANCDWLYGYTGETRDVTMQVA